MQFHDNLKARLLARLERLRQVESPGYPAESRYFMQFLESDAYINCLLNHLDASASVDFDAWFSEFDGQWQARFPSTESERAKVCHRILHKYAYQDNVNFFLHWGRKFGRSSDGEIVLRRFTENITLPLVNYLCDRIEDGSNVLYIMHRFKQKSEWFQRDELHSLYERNSRAGERHLDLKLREALEALFDGGVDFPFSQPESPSGKADVVIGVEAGDPLPVEVKVFDPANGKRARDLQQGFHQTFRYTTDYNQSVGYLVIFNCSRNELVILPDTGGESEYPVRIDYGGKTFFVFVSNINPHRASASRENPLQRTTVTYAELTATPDDQKCSVAHHPNLAI